MRGINVVGSRLPGTRPALAPTPELAKRMQGAALVGVFLRVAPLVAERGLTIDELMAAVKGPLAKSVGKRGGAVVDANLELIRAAYVELIDVTDAIRAVPSTVAVRPRRTEEALA